MIIITLIIYSYLRVQPGDRLLQLRAVGAHLQRVAAREGGQLHQGHLLRQGERPRLVRQLAGQRLPGIRGLQPRAAAAEERRHQHRQGVPHLLRLHRRLPGKEAHSLKMSLNAENISQFNLVPN